MTTRAVNPHAKQSGSPQSEREEAALDGKPPPAQPTVAAGHATDWQSAQPTARMPRGIVVLFSQNDHSPAPDSREALADLETIQTAQAVAEVLRQRTSWEVHLLPAAMHVERKLGAFPPQDYWVFNLFEGVDGLIRENSDGLLDEEAHTALTLEELGYRFTGAHGQALALAINKARAKAILREGGVLTPAWRVFLHSEELTTEALHGLHFPLIVKPVAEDSSLGIDANAVVSTESSLRAQVTHITAHYQQGALVEEFIDGREINAALWDDPPQILPLAEVDLKDLGESTQRIVSFAAKWEEHSFEYLHTPVACPAVIEEGLAQRIHKTALRAWQLIGGRQGYGRVDMRVQGERVYVLEVNPNPSIAPDAGFARCAKAAGYDYAAMILHIIALTGEKSCLPFVE